MAYTFTDFGAEVDRAMSGFAVEAASVVDMQIERPVYLALVIWAFVMGLLIMNGWTRTTFKEFVFTALKIGLLAMVGLNSFTYLTYVIDIGGNLDSWFISMLPNSMGSATPTNVWDSVTQLWAGSWDLVSRMLSIQVGWGIDSFFQSMVIILLAVVVGVGVLFMTNMALTLIVVNKVILAVMLGFGPLFICFAMFDWTKSLFSGWLRTVLSVIVTFTLFAAAVMLALAVLNPIVGEIETAAGGSEDGVVMTVLELSGVFLVICLSFAGLFRWIPMVAHNITGAIAGLVPPGLLASSRMTAGGALRTAAAGAGGAALTLAAGSAAASGIAGAAASAAAWAEGRRGERAAEAANRLSLAAGGTLEKGLNTMLGGRDDSGFDNGGSSVAAEPGPQGGPDGSGGGAVYGDGTAASFASADAQGAVGSSGPAGASGSAGSNGPAGYSSNGFSGAAGASGSDGAAGAAGSNGIGEAGTEGSAGAAGAQGVHGALGAVGASVVGASGASGIDGSVGATGSAGSTGLQGLSGSSAFGKSGRDGAPGAVGAAGVGLNGLRGVAGEAGTIGEAGADGLSGADGVTEVVTAGGSGTTVSPAAGAMRTVSAGSSFESVQRDAVVGGGSSAASVGAMPAASTLSEGSSVGTSTVGSAFALTGAGSSQTSAQAAASRLQSAAFAASAAASAANADVRPQQGAASDAVFGREQHADWQDRRHPDVRVAGPIRTGGSAIDAQAERPGREALSRRYGSVVGGIEDARDRAADAVHAASNAAAYAKAKASSEAWNRFASLAPKTALFARSYAAARAERLAKNEQTSLARKTADLKTRLDRAVNVVEGRAPMVGRGGFYTGYALGADNNEGPGDMDADGD